MEQTSENFWKKCSTCKKPIALGQKYYVCSVSTCNGQRTGYSFCSVICFESHLPGARHRDAGAVEKTAPLTKPVETAESPDSTGSANPEKRRIIASHQPTGVTTSSVSTQIPRDILIVASKLKDYIRAKSDMNTSASVMDVLSEIVRSRCDEAIESARREGRKTVLDRDFKK